MPRRIKILEIEKFYFTLYQPIYYRVSKKKGDLQKHGHNYSEIHQKRKEVGVFCKIQLKCCRMGPKHFKIGVKMA